MTKSNGAPPQQGHGLDGFYEALRRPGIVRVSDGRWFAGVSTGLARWLGVDPLIVRAGFILFSIFFGMGVALYLTLWLLMPDERGEVHIERALKFGEGHSIFLLIVTVISVLGGGPWWGGDLQGFRFGGFVLVVVLAWYFLTRTDSGRQLIGWPWTGGGQAGSQREAAGTPDVSSDPATAAGPGAGGPATTMNPSTGNAAANAGAAMATPRAVAPSPAPAPRERIRSIGFAAGLLVLGAAVVTGALVTQVARSGAWQVNPLAIGIAAGLGVLGLGILVAGIAGRRSGGLAPIAWLGIMAAIFTTAAPSGLTRPWQIGDQTHVPTTATSDLDYQLAMGQMKVDLANLTSTELDKTPGVDTVKAIVGLGELDIVVPDGVRVTVNATGRAGEIDATGSNNPANSGTRRDMRMTDTGVFRTEGTHWHETITYGPTTGTGAELVVDAEVGLGQIKVTTASAS